MPLDQATLELDAGAQHILAALIAFIMFSVALGLSPGDFRRVARRPGVVLYGVLLQIVCLPAMTFALAWLVAPTPSIALGMIVIAACPGGNASNFFTQEARGDAALSVSLTAISSVTAVLTTPLNIVVWASLHPGTRDLLTEIGVDRSAFVVQTALLLAVPLAAGMALAAWRPGLAARIRRPCRLGAFAALAVFIIAAVAANRSHLHGFGLLFLPVVIGHNALAMALGYGAARAAGLGPPVRRAFTFEIGIQNVGLGLIILLDHFEGLGGAALVTASWGAWHFISGLTMVAVWRRWRAPTLLPSPETQARKT